MTARSEAALVPFRAAWQFSSSINWTLRLSAPSTTWLLVTIRISPSLSPMMIPEPVDSFSCVYGCPKNWASSVYLLKTETIAGITFSATSATTVFTPAAWASTASTCRIEGFSENRDSVDTGVSSPASFFSAGALPTSCELSFPVFSSTRADPSVLDSAPAELLVVEIEPRLEI